MIIIILLIALGGGVALLREFGNYSEDVNGWQKGADNE